MSPNTLNDQMDQFHERALTGRTSEAVRFAVDLLDSGAPQERIITDVLARSQREVGDQWQRDEISVADEHVATGVTETALYALSPSRPDEPNLGRVVVACAEGDWHSIASHMFSEQLRAAGVTVSFLGASTPSGEVARFIERYRPDALIVTCNLPIFFSGVVSLANVAHDVGVPLLVGGRAVANSPQRASRLGSNAVAKDLNDVLATLARWRESPDEVDLAPVSLDTRVAAFESQSMDIAQAAHARLSTLFSPISRYTPRQRDRTLEDLRYIVLFMAASEYVDETSIFTEFLAWLDNVLQSRGVPRAALVLGLEALIPELHSADPEGGRLAQLGVEFLSNLG